MAIARKLVAFRLEQDILDGIDELRARDGIPASEQVRRALRAYLTRSGIALPRPTTATKNKRRRPR